MEPHALAHPQACRRLSDSDMRRCCLSASKAYQRQLSNVECDRG